MADVIQYITGAEFVKLMEAQDISGKHGCVFQDWEKIADYATHNAIDPSLPPFILIRELPIKWLQFEHMPDRPELIKYYSEKSPSFPPIYVTFSTYQLENAGDRARPTIKNGNHRVAAALCRGQATINAIMTQESWKNIRKQNFDKFRRNPSYYCS